jgi:hypothetical protein
LKPTRTARFLVGFRYGGHLEHQLGRNLVR